VIINNIFLKKNLKNIELDLLNLQNPFAKEESILHLIVINPTSDDKFDIVVDKKLQINIKANSKKSIYLKRVFEKRGMVEKITIELSSTFPLNMFDRYYAIAEFDGEFIIYPERKGIPLKEAFGDRKEIFGVQDDFKGTRKYQNGDKASMIYWKSLAKGKLETKEFEYVAPFDGYIFDFEKIEGDTESRLSQITLWVTEATEANLDFLVKLKKQTFNSKEMDSKEILRSLALWKD